MGMPVIMASDTKRKQAITDIIESVALEEAALAHILNAEGEELHKIACMNHFSTNDLVKANDSVKSLIDTITKLEIVLESKCDLFEDCLCDDRHHFNDYDPDCDCDCDYND